MAGASREAGRDDNVTCAAVGEALVEVTRGDGDLAWTSGLGVALALSSPLLPG